MAQKHISFSLATRVVSAVCICLQAISDVVGCQLVAKCLEKLVGKVDVAANDRIKYTHISSFAAVFYRLSLFKVSQYTVLEFINSRTPELRSVYWILY